MATRKRARGGRREQALVLLMGLAAQGLAHGDDSQTAAPDKVLGEVTVRADQGLGAQTEGTHSYTTGAAKTATPLSLSLRDTPQSVSVITQQRIEDQGMQTITDVVNNTTGVSVNQYESNRAQFNARGFDINTLMIDGVPTTWDQSWSSGEVMSSLAMYDRVEVVRGATGLTTGAGEPGAAINLVRKHASSKELTGSVEAGIGSWGEHRLMGDVSGALNQAGTIRARLVAEQNDGDSWVKRQRNTRQTVYGTVEADLTPNTLLRVGISNQDNSTNAPTWGGLSYWYADGSRTNWPVSKTTSADWARWDSRYTTYFTDLEHRFDNGWKAKASFQRGDREADSWLLYMYGAPDRTTGIGLYPYAGSYRTQTIQDTTSLQLNGPFKLLGRTHELAFGYIMQRSKFNAYNRSAGSVGAVGDFNSWDGTSMAEPTWGPVTPYQTDVTRQNSMYGVARFNLADPLRLIVGARLTDYLQNGAMYPASYTPGTYDMSFRNQVTPYAGLIYDINSHYSVYASYTDIFQPQQLQDINGKYLNPVLGKSLETGIKGEFLNGRVNGSLAVFRIEQDNLGQAAGVNLATGNAYYTATSGATSKGFEAEVSGELKPGWSVSAGYSQGFYPDFTDTPEKAYA